MMKTYSLDRGMYTQPLDMEKAWVPICFSLVVFLLFFSSCGSQAGKVTLTEADMGKTVQVHTGDQITLQLDENPSTGYLWAIDKTDETLLALQHSDYTPPPGGALGSGGARLFTFIAKNPGTVHLQLKLWQSFEGNSSIIRRYDVTIQVQNFSRSSDSTKRATLQRSVH